MNKSRIICLLLFSAVTAIGALYVLSTRGYLTPSANAQVNTFATSSYVSASTCAGCHADKFTGWNQTNHAHAVMLIQNASGNFYSIGAANNLAGTPSRIYNETSFRNSCRNCHVTGGNNWDPINANLTGPNRTWPDRTTDPAKFLNIQCEVCHGAYQSHGSTNRAMAINYSASLCMQCHAPGTSHDFSYDKSGHAQSLTDLINSGHAADSCLHCMSAQGSIGLNPTLSTPNLAPISCITCHDVHSHTYEAQIRYEESTELCGQCHEQAEVFENSAHSKAGLECTSCHGQGTHLAHGDPNVPVMNHTWGIYKMHYPYNQTEPLVCSNCHNQTWATSQLGVIQSLTTDIVADVSQAIDSAKAAITSANQTSGVNVAKINLAVSLVNFAEANMTYVTDDNSLGFHNPEQSYAVLNTAAQLASQAETTALTAKADALGQTVTTLQSERSTLQTQVTDLQSQVTTLQTDVEALQASIDSLQSTVNTSPYLYSGMGLGIGFVIGAVIIYTVRRRKQ